MFRAPSGSGWVLERVHRNGKWSRMRRVQSELVIVFLRVTLKALANSSPGFALKPWVQKCPRRSCATLKGLRGFAVTSAGATLSEFLIGNTA
jgi:hypothetical protein